VKNAELANEVAGVEGISVSKAKQIIGTVFDEIGDALRGGDEVNLGGFGKFKALKQDARTGRNPATGESIDIPAKTVPKFSAAAALKEKVNSKRRR
jgi:nucleoid DNA-binding protein